jgi:hypothetical protein
MTERGQQLHAIADGQIVELIDLVSALDQAALRLPCPGREKLGDGTIAASARHTADNYQRIAAFVETSDRMSTPARTEPAQRSSHPSGSPRSWPRPRKPRRTRTSRPTRDLVHGRQHAARRPRRAALSLASHPRSHHRAHRQPAERDPTEGQLQILRRATHPRTGPRQPAEAPTTPGRRPRRRHSLTAALRPRRPLQAVAEADREHRATKKCRSKGVYEVHRLQ